MARPDTLKFTNPLNKPDQPNEPVVEVYTKDAIPKVILQEESVHSVNGEKGDVILDAGDIKRTAGNESVEQSLVDAEDEIAKRVKIDAFGTEKLAVVKAIFSGDGTLLRFTVTSRNVDGGANPNPTVYTFLTQGHFAASYVNDQPVLTNSASKLYAPFPQFIPGLSGLKIMDTATITSVPDFATQKYAVGDQAIIKNSATGFSYLCVMTSVISTGGGATATITFQVVAIQQGAPNAPTHGQVVHFSGDHPSTANPAIPENAAADPNNLYVSDTTGRYFTWVGTEYVQEVYLYGSNSITVTENNGVAKIEVKLCTKEDNILKVIAPPPYPDGWQWLKGGEEGGVETFADLPYELPQTGVNYLCRVRNATGDPNTEYNPDGVYWATITAVGQIPDWEYYTSTQTWIEGLYARATSTYSTETKIKALFGAHTWLNIADCIPTNPEYILAVGDLVIDGHGHAGKVLQFGIAGPVNPNNPDDPIGHPNQIQVETVLSGNELDIFAILSSPAPGVVILNGDTSGRYWIPGFDTTQPGVGIYNAVTNHTTYQLSGLPQTTAAQYASNQFNVYGDSARTFVEAQLFVAVKALQLGDYLHQPISVMYQHILNTRSFLFYDNPADEAANQWHFGNFANFDFSSLISDELHLRSISIARDIVINKANQEVYVDDMAQSGGRTYIYRNGAMEVPLTAGWYTANIIGAALVMKDCFDTFGKAGAEVIPADVVALSPFIQFTRKAYTVDLLRMVYHDLANMIEYGLLRQEGINVNQDALLAEKIDRIFLENVQLPKVAGRIDFPIVALPDEVTNPLFVGRFATLASLKAATNPTDYVDFSGVTPVAKGNFAYLDNGYVALVQPGGSSAQGRLVEDITYRAAEPETGTRITSITFPQFTDIDWYTLYANGGTNTQAFLTLSKWNERLNTTQIRLSIRNSGAPTSGLLLLYFGGGNANNVQIGTSAIQGYRGSFTEVYDGITVQWDLPTRTLSFSEPLGALPTPGFDDVIKATWSANVFQGDGVFYHYGDGSGVVWDWLQTGYYNSDARYPEFITGDGTGRAGALRSSQYLRLTNDSRLLLPVASAPAIAEGLLNGIILKFNPSGTRGNPNSYTRYSNADNSLFIRYSCDAQFNVNATYGTVAPDGEEIITKTVPLIMGTGNSWVYPEREFDPIDEFNLVEDFFYRSEANDPFGDTRITSSRVINVPELYDLWSWLNGKTPQFYDPAHSDMSIEVDMTRGDGSAWDFEFGFILPQAPHAGLPAGTYDGDILAIGGQITFPSPDPITGETTSTLYKFNHGDSNITEQLLGWASRPIYYNGQTGIRHWLELRDDVNVTVLTNNPLTRVMGGQTVLSLSVVSIAPVIGKTLISDARGTVAVACVPVSDPGIGNFAVKTIATSLLGEDEPTLLTPSVQTYGQGDSGPPTYNRLPMNMAEALIAFNGYTPAIDDYCRVHADEAATDRPEDTGSSTERYITNIDTTQSDPALQTIEWGNYIVINTADYQEQTPAAWAGKILTAGATIGTFGEPIDPDDIGSGRMMVFVDTKAQLPVTLAHVSVSDIAVVNADETNGNRTAFYKVTAIATGTGNITWALAKLLPTRYGLVGVFLNQSELDAVTGVVLNDRAIVLADATHKSQVYYVSDITAAGVVTWSPEDNNLTDGFYLTADTEAQALALSAQHPTIPVFWPEE